MGFFNKITIIIMLAIFAVGMLDAVKNVGIERVKSQFADQPGKSVIALIGLNQGLNAITPSFQFNISSKVPVIGGKRIFMINDIPLPDGTDMIFLVPLLLLVWFPILKLLRSKIHPGVWILVAVFGTVIVIILGWVAVKLFWYFMYIWSAKALGMTKAQALATRDSVIMTLGETIYIMLVFAIFSVVAMTKIMWETVRGGSN